MKNIDSPENPPIISEEEQKKMKWRESFLKYPNLIEEDFIYTFAKVSNDFYIENPDVLDDTLKKGEIAREVLLKNNDKDTLGDLNKSLDKLKSRIHEKIIESVKKWEESGELNSTKLENLEKIYLILGDNTEVERYREMKEKLKTNEAK